MKTVNTYIFKQTLIGFLAILISLTTLIWLTQSLRMIDMIVTKGVSVGIFLKMTLLVLPNFLQILSPLALFGVVLFVFIRMQADKELIVLKAVGMSSKQLLKPLQFLAFLLIIGGYFLTLYIIPKSFNERKEIRWQIQNNLSHLLLQEGQFTSFKNGSTLYIRERENSGKVRGILAYEMKDDKKSTLIAREGSMMQTPEGISLTFNNGIRQEYTPQTQQFSILKFDKYTMLFSDKAGKSKHKMDPREMTLKQLIQVTPEMIPDAPLYRKCKVEAFKRLTQPLYNLLFLWLAAFGVLHGFYNRRGQSKQINAIIFCALLLQSFSLAFENIAVRNLWGIILMASNLFIPLIVLYFVLIKERKMGFISLSVFLAVIGLASPSFAVPKINLDHINPKAPIDFEADHMSYDAHKNIITATGNVILRQDQLKIKTDKILYNKEKDEVLVPHKTQLSLADGTQSTVENMTLSPKQSKAEANSITNQFTDGSLLSAEKMHTSDGNIIILQEATYTPCHVCQGEAPLWQIGAKKITQDFTDHTLSFNHMFLDIMDFPILYFPYFQIPDMTIKRKTGFLAPAIRHTREMGLAIETPFFVNLAQNQNLLFTPEISFNHLPLGIIDYSGRFTKGIVNLQLSGTKDNDSAKQGHIKTNFEYDTTENLRLSGQYFRTINDTYFRRYTIPNVDDSESFLRSHLTAEYFGTRFYTQAKAWHFQSLVNGVNSESIPIVIPTVDSNYTTAPLTDSGLIAFTKINAAMYNTRTHLKSNRLSGIQGFELPYTTGFGLVTKTRASVRLDGYALNINRDTLVSTRNQQDSFNKGRFSPIASTKISYPLGMYTESTTQIFEPIVMLIASPNSKNSSEIPNIDSSIFDFDDTNLFSENRFAGYDRIEYGNRVNYGFQWTAYHNENRTRSFSFLFGQVYRLHANDELSDVMGYSNHLSDYVGHVQMNYQYMNLSYRFRLDQKNFSKRKNDVGFQVGNDPLRLGINYLYQASYVLDDKYYDEEDEIRFNASSQLTKNWQTSGYYRYNLKKHGGPIEYGWQLRYDNECTAVSMNVSKSYARDRNYKGSTSIVFKLLLKTLGGLGE